MGSGKDLLLTTTTAERISANIRTPKSRKSGEKLNQDVGICIRLVVRPTFYTIGRGPTSFAMISGDCTRRLGISGPLSSLMPIAPLTRTCTLAASLPGPANE